MHYCMPFGLERPGNHHTDVCSKFNCLFANEYSTSDIIETADPSVEYCPSWILHIIWNHMELELNSDGANGTSMWKENESQFLHSFTAISPSNIGATNRSVNEKWVSTRLKNRWMILNELRNRSGLGRECCKINTETILAAISRILVWIDFLAILNDCICSRFVSFNRLRSIVKLISFILRVVWVVSRCRLWIEQTKCFRPHVRLESNDLNAPKSNTCSKSDAHGHHSELRPNSHTHTHTLSNKSRCAVCFAFTNANVWLLVTLNNSTRAAAIHAYRHTVLWAAYPIKIHIHRSLRNSEL